MKAKIPKLVRLAYPHRLWQGPREGKKIYLTFDDGPIPEVTPWVLDQLKIYRAKATFFCIGDNIRKHSHIFEQVVLDGHSVGNHTFNHLNGWKTSVKEYLENVEKCQQILECLPNPQDASEEKGLQNRHFRPPYGRLRSTQAKLLKEKGMQIVMWDVLSMDYDAGLSPEKCYHNVTNNAGSGSIIVFHDSLKAEKNLKWVLPKVLEHYTQEGYSFERLEQPL